MARRDVEEYYQRMVSDYTESKRVLVEMEKCITEENASKFMENIKSMKERVQLLESNYKRLSYIMFLLNMPNKKEKKTGYIKREQKRLSSIPEKHRKDAVIKENSAVITELKSYLKED